MADFQESFAAFAAEGIRVLAASVEPLGTTAALAADLRLGFPVGFGLDCEETAKRIGAFYEAEKRYFHATGFILDPEGRVKVACYSTGAIGRLTAQDSLALIKYYMSQGG